MDKNTTPLPLFAQHPHDCPETVHRASACPEMVERPATELLDAATGEILDVPDWLVFLRENVQGWPTSDGALTADTKLIAWADEARIPDVVMQVVAENMAARMEQRGKRWTDGKHWYVNIHLTVRGWVRSELEYRRRQRQVQPQRYLSTNGHQNGNGRAFRY